MIEVITPLYCSSYAGNNLRVAPNLCAFATFSPALTTFFALRPFLGSILRLEVTEVDRWGVDAMTTVNTNRIRKSDPYFSTLILFCLAYCYPNARAQYATRLIKACSIQAGTIEPFPTRSIR